MIYMSYYESWVISFSVRVKPPRIARLATFQVGSFEDWLWARHCYLSRSFDQVAFPRSFGLKFSWPAQGHHLWSSAKPGAFWLLNPRHAKVRRLGFCCHGSVVGLHESPTRCFGGCASAATRSMLTQPAESQTPGTVWRRDRRRVRIIPVGKFPTSWNPNRTALRFVVAVGCMSLRSWWRGSCFFFSRIMWSLWPILLEFLTYWKINMIYCSCLVAIAASFV